MTGHAVYAHPSSEPPHPLRGHRPVIHESIIRKSIVHAVSATDDKKTVGDVVREAERVFPCPAVNHQSANFNFARFAGIGGGGYRAAFFPGKDVGLEPR